MDPCQISPFCSLQSTPCLFFDPFLYQSWCTFRSGPCFCCLFSFFFISQPCKILISCSKRTVLSSHVQYHAGQKQVSGPHIAVRQNKHAWLWNQARLFLSLIGSNYDNGHKIWQCIFYFFFISLFLPFLRHMCFVYTPNWCLTGRVFNKQRS